MSRRRVVPDVLAAVDLGSNSFHMVVARYSHGQLVILDRLREMVRLAAGLGRSAAAGGLAFWTGFPTHPTYKAASGQCL